MNSVLPNRYSNLRLNLSLSSSASWLRRAILLSVASSLLLACSKGETPPEAPSNVQASPGDQRVQLSWSSEAGADYWAFASSDPTISLNNWTTQTNAKVVRNIRSPGAVTGLTNGVTYYFIINGRNRAGTGGDASQVVSATPRAAGDTWSAGTLVTGVNLRAVAATETLLAIAGAAGSLFTSSDALAWSTVASGSSQNFNAGTFGGGYYVMAGDAGTVTRSSDGITWIVQNTNLTPNLLDLVYLNGGFVTVGDGGLIATSADANNWIVRTPPVTTTLYGVTFGNSRYVAVGAGGTILYSNDNNSYLQTASPLNVDWRGVAFGNLQYVAVGSGGQIITSVDGLSWTVTASPTTSDLLSVSFSGSRFVATGKGGVVVRSDDGLNWALGNSGTTRDLARVSFGQGRFIGLGDAGLNIDSR